ncbi:MAG TPA: TIGR01212 family radical SAM protein [Candidatus Ornithospirochaeta avicola]|uniref:TIGR01212 family radical SAM protein n=1 Tax=Candidatus Ornithospirochaeta avicola TaxID=2840896 RepID=A0A9D1PTZ0_9SPIO|nr:TIGR01212 family radical SAM protein [Candidatus Ornithospirochaeta avicola]
MRWHSYKEYLEEKYHKRVYRIGVDAGFSCPNRDKNKGGGCAFCDGTGSVATYQRRDESLFHHDSQYNSVVAEKNSIRVESIRKQIEKGREFLTERYGAEAFALYLQSYTNTYDSIKNLERIYSEALSCGDFIEFIISTRPDEIDEERLDLIESFATPERQVSIELGLQSANDRTLERINRGHDLECYLKAAEMIKKRDIMLSTHVILGLPGEGDEDFVRTSRAVSLYSDFVKIHNLHITGGTRLAEEWRKGEVKLLSFDEYLDAVILFLRHLRKDIVIQRLISETPSHRLIAPRSFPDKSRFLSLLEAKMEEMDVFEGDLYETM